MFQNGKSSYNCISWSASLLGGIHLCSWNTFLHGHKRLSKCFFLSLVHPSKDTLLFPNHIVSYYVLRKEKQNFYLNWSFSFLGWQLLEIFDLSLCVLMIEYFPSFIKWYWFYLLMNITSILYIWGFINTTPQTPRGIASTSSPSYNFHLWKIWSCTILWP